MNKKYIFGAMALVAVVLIVWSTSTTKTNDIETEVLEESGEVLSRTGLHTHPKLEIIVDGEAVSVPGDIGVGAEYLGTPTYDKGMRMTAMHTHDQDGTIHLEFPKLVKKEDLKLSNFFAIWGKEFMSFGTSVTMTVNGVENNEFGDYEMKDEDLIVLNYSNN